MKRKLKHAWYHLQYIIARFILHWLKTDEENHELSVYMTRMEIATGPDEMDEIEIDHKRRMKELKDTYFTQVSDLKQHYLSKLN